MDLTYSEEQEMLREAARKFVAAECSSQRVRRIMESETAHDPALWEKMAGQGWTALLLPEAHGGLGLSFLDLCIVLEEMGKGPLPGPFFASTVLGAQAIALSDNVAARDALLPGLASGERIAALATADGAAPARARRDGSARILSGEKSFVLDAGVADWIVVAAEDALLAVDRAAEGVGTTPLRSMDRTRRQYAVRLENVRVGPERVLAEGPRAREILDRVALRGAVGLCAEMVGGMQWVLETTVAYVKTRRQFDVPIGSFQAVKHPLANLWVELEGARSLALYASWCADAAPDRAPAAAAMAKSYANEAFLRAAGAGIQLHGGIGFTWEHDLHLFLKRAKCSALQMGTTSEQLERLAAAIGL